MARRNEHDCGRVATAQVDRRRSKQIPDADPDPSACLSWFGVTTDLQPAGSSLANPFVYADAARELEPFAARRLIEIVAEQTMRHADESHIGCLSFKPLR